MKKLFLITCFLSSILMLNAKAVEFKPYVGANLDIVAANKNNIEDKGDPDEHTNFGNKQKFGINFGSKIDINDDVFLFGELYINILNKSVESKYSVPDWNLIESAKHEFKNLYGLNFGLGYNFDEKFNIRMFASIDKNKLKWRYSDVDSRTGALHYANGYTKSKIGFGLGFDLGYNVTENIETKLGYKFSHTIMHDFDEYLLKEYPLKVQTHSINLGLAYNF